MLDFQLNRRYLSSWKIYIRRRYSLSECRNNRNRWCCIPARIL